MSDGPDLLERTRMALADCGIDPDLVSQTADERQHGIIGHWPVDHPTKRMLWRAVELARAESGDSPQACLACSLHWGPGPAEEVAARRSVCRATFPLTEDCGVDRSAS